MFAGARTGAASVGTLKFMFRSNSRPEPMIAMSHHGQRGAHAAVAPSTPILIVDHDRGISTSLAFMLSARGYDEVRAVRSAARAIAVAAKFHPGIVFLDIERSETESLDQGRSCTEHPRQIPRPRSKGAPCTKCGHPRRA
jgi:PleD family two-component response regulator